MAKWLVEIRLKDWEAPLLDNSRVVAYEEVEATTEVGARYTGIEQFEARLKYEPSFKKKMQLIGAEGKDVCAPDAVELD